MKPSLEFDLLKTDWIIKKCEDRTYAVDLYNALCNNLFIKNNIQWSCSWRTAGGIVADLRNERESYLDFYCSGNEAEVTEEIKLDLMKLEWTIDSYKDNDLI